MSVNLFFFFALHTELCISRAWRYGPKNDHNKK